jgi:Tfp pilus assembly protein PilO
MREPSLPRGSRDLTRGFSILARKGAFVVFFGVIGLIAIAALPHVWNAQVRQKVAAQKAELTLVEARARRASENRPRLTEADQPARMFLPGRTAGTTLAALQSLVSKAAGNSGMSVLRMQPLPVDEVAGASPLRLSVDAKGSLEQLRAFLTDIETMLPLITVTGLDIVPRAGEGPEAQAYPSEDLAVTLKLEAFAWRDAP